MFKKAGIILVTNFVFFGAASADVKWVQSQSQSCATVCENSNLTAVSSGEFKGQKFYICAGQLAEDTSNRPGFNLVQDWSPNGEKCFTSSGKIATSVSVYDCLCQLENATASSKPNSQTQENTAKMILNRAPNSCPAGYGLLDNKLLDAENNSVIYNSICNLAKEDDLVADLSDGAKVRFTKRFGCTIGLAGSSIGRETSMASVCHKK